MTPRVPVAIEERRQALAQDLEAASFSRHVRGAGGAPDQPLPGQELLVLERREGGRGEPAVPIDDTRIELAAFDRILAVHGADRLDVGPRQGIARVPAVPHQREAPAGPQDPVELLQRLGLAEPVERLGAHHQVHAPARESGRLGGAFVPAHPRVGRGRRAHRGVRLDGNHARAAVGQLPGEDPGPGPHVGGHEARGIGQAAQDGVDCRGRIAGAIPDVVGGAVAEAAGRVQLVQVLGVVPRRAHVTDSRGARFTAMPGSARADRARRPSRGT